MNQFSYEALENLSDLIGENDVFQHKTIKKVRKNNARQYQNNARQYQYYNQLCACIVRIRETCNYIAAYQFRKENIFGQAFDFYEYVNCVSIVLGCTEILFDIFNVKLTDYYKSKKVFLKSNKTNQSDIKFFKFVRSASAVHPAETTNYNKITRLKSEFYPYAIWYGGISSFLVKDAPTGADIELVGWNSRSKCFNKHYYFYLYEFNDFVNELLVSINNIIPLAQKIVDTQREKERCKALKSVGSFCAYSDYLKYLRGRLLRKNKSEEFADGGLLLAAHIYDNTIIGNELREYIEQRVIELTAKMKKDLSEISYNDIFDELSLYSLIKDWSEQSHYITEKYDDYLREQARYEIETGNYQSFSNAFNYYENNCQYSNAEWSVRLLIPIWDKLFVNTRIFEAKCFTDIYELVLEEIYLQTRLNNKLTHQF